MKTIFLSDMIKYENSIIYDRTKLREKKLNIKWNLDILRLSRMIKHTDIHYNSLCVLTYVEPILIKT